jgi:hypothetical protein
LRLLEAEAADAKLRSISAKKTISKLFGFWVEDVCNRIRGIQEPRTLIEVNFCGQNKKTILNPKKNLLANFQHDCCTNGLRTVRQSLKFLIL